MGHNTVQVLQQGKLSSLPYSSEHSAPSQAAGHSQASLTSKEASKAISELCGGIVGDGQSCDLRRRHTKISQPCSIAAQVRLL